MQYLQVRVLSLYQQTLWTLKLVGYIQLVLLKEKIFSILINLEEYYCIV